MPRQLIIGFFVVSIFGWTGQASKHIEETEYSIPTKECKAGFSLMGDVCRKVETRQPFNHCKPGWKLTDGMCTYKVVEIVPGECPKGGIWDGKKCVSKTTVDWINACQHDFSLENGRCFRTNYIDPDYRCPKGFKHSGDGTCFTETKGDVESKCPDGYVPAKHGCAQCSELAPIQICEHGFELRDGLCIQEDRHEPEMRCHSGYLLDEKTGKCSRRLQKIAQAVCTAGSEYDKTARVCITKTSIDILFKCPDGYELKGNQECIKILHEEPIPYCPDGYLYDGIKCIALEYDTPSFECAPDEIYGDGFCVKLELAEATIHCRSGFVAKGGVCRSTASVQPQEGCDRGYTLCDGVCRRVVTVPLESVCRDGEFRGKKCIAYKTIGADPFCKKGNFDGSKCIVREDSNPIRVCPHGYDNLKDGTCGRFEYSEAIISCPEGTIRVGKHGCENMLAEYPEKTCPKSFSLLNAICQKSYEGTPYLICPAGWKLKDGRCSRHSKRECVGYPCSNN